MKKKDNYLIFAHYHSSGLLRKDILKFLKIGKIFFKKIIFVSTKINRNQKIKDSKNIKLINRENIGYDFYSYKTGLNFLKKEFKDDIKNKNIFFINSSILHTNPKKFFNVLKKIKIKDNELWGLSKSYELAEHIQTYFFFLSANLLYKKEIYNWWSKMKPLKKRQQIIDHYELGLSDLMKKNQIKLRSVFKKNINLKTNSFFKKIKQRFKEIFFKEPKYYKKNPTNYFWRHFYNHYGIVKIELIKNNYKKLNIKKLIILLKKKHNLYLEAINN